MFPYEVFDTVTQKISNRNSWHNPLSKTFPHIRNYWSTKRFLQEFFSALWAKNFLKDIVILSLHLPPPPSPLPPLLSIKTFDTRNFVKHNCSPTEFFDTVWQKTIDRKIGKNDLNQKKNRCPKRVTHWTVPLRNDSVLPPSPFPLIQKKFRYRKFWEAQNGPLTKFLGTVRQQIFYRKSYFSPPS